MTVGVRQDERLDAHRPALPALGETKRRRDSLDSEISSVTRQIESKRSEQDRLRKTIREHRTELAGL